MSVLRHDTEILRALARRVADAAALPVNEETAGLWRRLNDLQPVRPMVWLDEHCWHELNVNDELTLRCEDEWARGLEQSLRRRLYSWQHIRGDMIIDGYIASPVIMRGEDFGIHEDVDIVSTDAASDVVSRHFNPLIVEPEDIEKIQMPRVEIDHAATEREFNLRNVMFADILPVRKRGVKHHWFTPWDNLIRFWGIQQAMMDLVLRPDMVNAAVARWVNASLSLLDQYEALEILELNNDNTRIGSGGYGQTKDLPGDGYAGGPARAKHMWGCSNAQIFSEVSPNMHWEFALQHEMRYLKRWGLTYYGCCEPLDRKMHILSRIPNLRKVSMSPKVDPARGAEALQRKYVYSMKPNPAILAGDNWNLDRARNELRDALEKTRGCNVEIILKDISTVRYEPRRLWEWTDMAMNLAQEFAP